MPPDDLSFIPPFGKNMFFMRGAGLAVRASPLGTDPGTSKITRDHHTR